MKSTKYLYNTSETPEGMISVSQLQTYLSCRKKWEYSYIDGVAPRVDRSYLTIGKLCHRGMQVAMQSAWRSEKTLDKWKEWRDAGIHAIKEEFAKYIQITPLLNEELPDLNKMADDSISVFSQAFEEFEPWKYEVLTLKKGRDLIPALELHFRVPCAPTKGMHGYIDAILRDTETNFVWCTDYKFRKTLSPDEDETNNIQNAVYAYACQKMGVDITGTMTWQHLNTPAAEPLILKNGTVSRAKIKTTWTKYSEFCIMHGIDPESYKEEMQGKLSDIEWFRITYEYRNPITIDRIWEQCILPGARLIKAARRKDANNFRSMYPWNCKMCQFQSLCQAELRDYDINYILTNEYTKRSSTKIDNKSIDDNPVPVI